ncbi:MAG: serine/threonine protein kinase [Acidobacteria bacterium]|nr:serine/threonine protein kinase [Acidobacteriota bacterium]
MQAERWQQIEALFHAVLEVAPERRAAFLQQACQDDESLRMEVERLLASDSEAQAFMKSRALGVAARALAKGQSGVAELTGKTILHYRISEKLGAGGMGEVYRAEDAVLGRQVALKVLPDIFAGDPERLARFEREAKLLASLNHPNIASIYGLEEADGKHFLVLELVEGKTLAERLHRRPFPVEEALEICRQIAEGLEAAHEKGIIHRDLKPANVKVTPEGKVKILDFGLARALHDQSATADLSQSPTVTDEMTRPGVILGTAAYMSPEQAKGKTVDKRADIWAFGCVLYECLTGKRAFQGDTITETVAAILKSEPDWTLLPGETPASVRSLLRRCLQKDPNLRLRDIGDARVEMLEGLAEPAEVIPGARRFPLMWVLSVGVVALVIGVLIGLAAMGRLRPAASPASQPVVRASVRLEAGHWLDGQRRNPPYGLGHPTRTAIALSSDGRLMVYSAISENPGPQDKPRLYLRRFDQLEAKPVAGTEGGDSPFLSPDDRWIGFCAEGKLMKVAVDGGVPAPLCDIPYYSAFGFSWGTDNRIIFARIGDFGLSRVSADGGTPEILTIPDRSKEEFAHRLPHCLPAGKGILFTIMRHGYDLQPRVAAVDPATRKWRVLLEDGADARYVATGHLAFLRQGTLMVVPFDPDRLEVRGQPVPAVANVMQALNDGDMGYHTAAGQYSISSSGSMAYVPGGILPDSQNSLVWVDHEGRTEAITPFKAPFSASRLSPDGQRIAYRTWSRERQVWVYDLNRGTATKLTSEGVAGLLTWTLDGRRLVFEWMRAFPTNLYWQAADGSSPMEQLTKSENGARPGSWSPDGETLAFVEYGQDGGWDILLLHMRDRKVAPLLNSRFNEMYPEFSPDGRWIAYASNESGRTEVYVRPFPAREGKWPISNEGGTEPLWSRNGKQLFYRRSGQVWVVDVLTGSGFSAGKPRLLFEQSGYLSNQPIREWDISADGRRFLMVKLEERKPQPVTELILVQNWFEELKRLVPAGKK